MQTNQIIEKPKSYQRRVFQVGSNGQVKMAEKTTEIHFIEVEEIEEIEEIEETKPVESVVQVAPIEPIKKKEIVIIQDGSREHLSQGITEDSTGVIRSPDDKIILNLNTHLVKVKTLNGFATFPAYHKKTKIVYTRIADPIAPGAFKMISSSIENLPSYRVDQLYLVNRDTISATRKIELRMRKQIKFRDAFAFIDNDSDWRKNIRKEHPKQAKNLLRYVNRIDLRAPGEQVRINNKVDHCIELLSEFE